MPQTAWAMFRRVRQYPDRAIDSLRRVQGSVQTKGKLWWQRKNVATALRESTRASNASRSRAVPTLLWIVWGASLLAFLCFAWAGAYEGWSDEVIHRYVAKRVSEGARLYGTIHSARPPIVIWTLALLIWVGIPNLLAAKLLTVGLHLGIAGVLILGGHRLMSLRAGVLSSCFYLLSAQTLARSDYTGIHWVALFSCLVVYYGVRGRPAAAGTAAGFAMASGQHAAVLVGVVPLLLWYRAGATKIKTPLQYAAACTLVFGSFCGSAYLVGGDSIFQDLVGRHLYHVTGTHRSSNLGWWITLFGCDELWLYLLALLGTCAGAVSIEQRYVRCIFILAAIHVCVVVWMQGGLILYMFPVLPLFSWCAGHGADFIWHRFHYPRGYFHIPSFRLGLIGILLLTYALGSWQARELLKERDGESYSFASHFRYFEMSGLTRLRLDDRLADTISDLPAGATIYGYPILASAAALYADRRVSADLADLPFRWFHTGAVQPQDVIRKIENDRVEIFISHKNGIDLHLQKYLKKHYKLETNIPRSIGEGKGIPAIYIFRRNR